MQCVFWIASEKIQCVSVSMGVQTRAPYIKLLLHGLNLLLVCALLFCLHDGLLWWHTSSPLTHASHHHSHMHPITTHTCIPSPLTHASHHHSHMHPITTHTCIPSPLTHASHHHSHMHPSTHTCNPSPLTSPHHMPHTLTLHHTYTSSLLLTVHFITPTLHHIHTHLHLITCYTHLLFDPALHVIALTDQCKQSNGIVEVSSSRLKRCTHMSQHTPHNVFTHISILHIHVHTCKSLYPIHTYNTPTQTDPPTHPHTTHTHTHQHTSVDWSNLS